MSARTCPTCNIPTTSLTNCQILGLVPETAFIQQADNDLFTRMPHILEALEDDGFFFSIAELDDAPLDQHN